MDIWVILGAFVAVLAFIALLRWLGFGVSAKDKSSGAGADHDGEAHTGGQGDSRDSNSGDDDSGSGANIASDEGADAPAAPGATKIIEAAIAGKDGHALDSHPRTHVGHMDKLPKHIEPLIDSLLYGYKTQHKIVSKDGRAALLFDHDNVVALIRIHGTQPVACRLKRPVHWKVGLNNMILVESGLSKIGDAVLVLTPAEITKLRKML